MYAPTVEAKLYPETYIYGSTASGWATTPLNVRDNNTGTYATAASINGPAWTSKLIMNLTYTCNGTKIQYWASQSNAGVYTTLNITVANATGSWLKVYSATPTEGSYQNCTFTTAIYTAIGFERYRPSGTTARYARMNEAQAVNASYSSPYPYTVASNVTASISLSTVIQVNYKKTTTLSESTMATLSEMMQFQTSTNATCSITLRTNIEVVYYGGLTETGTVTLSSDIRANYHVGTICPDSIDLDLYTVNASLTQNHEILDLNNTVSIGLDTSIQVNYHIGLAGTESIAVDAKCLTDYNPSLNETGTISLITDIQVNYHASFSMPDSTNINLSIEGQQGISMNTTSTLTLTTYVQVEYHPVFVGANTTGVLSLNSEIHVSYHLRTMTTETLTLTQSKRTSFCEVSSLAPKIGSSIYSPGRYVIPDAHGPPPDFTPFPRYVFDLKIINLTYIYGFEQFALTRTTWVSVNMTNAEGVSGDAILNWWVEDATTGTSVSSGSQTVLMNTGESKLVVFSFELEKGNYVFHSEVDSIGGKALGSPAVATLAFSVGYIYIDFMKDYYVPILIVIVFLLGICAIYRRTRHARKHATRKRTRRKR